MCRTRYSNLSDREVLREFDDARQYSPIIEELCRRLESSSDECPVCEADLTKARRELE